MSDLDTDVYRIQLCIVAGVEMSDAQVSREVPRGRNREATTARLLDAAAEVFAEVGLGAASVEAICERAGFTRGAFYSNFASKNELFLRLAARVSHERTAAVRERVMSLEQPLDPYRVEDLVRVLGDVTEDTFEVLLFTEIAAQAMRDAELGAMLQAENERMTDQVAQIIAMIADRGDIRLRIAPRDAARLLLAVWSDATQRAALERADAERTIALRADDVGRAVRLIIDTSASPIE